MNERIELINSWIDKIKFDRKKPIEKLLWRREII